MKINNQDFTGKVALVTGAAVGMGFATAQAFAEAGASVVLADRDEPMVRSATGKLTAAGHKAVALACDVADDAQVAVLSALAPVGYTGSGKSDSAWRRRGTMECPHC
jgi:NAD(P)-dependent dehydrogenase (short-subunit alcohol dehydrogenase family)